MSDLISFFDFAMDIVCMMFPLDEVEALTLTRDESIFVSLTAIGILMFSITISAMKELFPQNAAAAVIVAACIVGIGFLGIDQEMLKGLFIVSYPPMVVAMRFGEGAIVGGKASRHLRWWHSLVLVGIIATVYFLLRPLPDETLSLAKGCWALLGAGVAAFMWTRMMASSPMLRSPLSVISIFAVFVSTIAYVSASPLERSLYQWSLPIGLVAGIIGSRASGKGYNGPHDDNGQAADEV